MPLDPIAKKAYDKERYAKMKQEFLANNPNYIPARKQQENNRTKIKNKYLDNQQQNNQPTLTGGGLGDVLKEHYDNLPKPPPPKPVYNPNGLEAKKRPDAYADDLEHIRLNDTPQKYNQIKNQLEEVNFKFVGDDKPYIILNKNPIGSAKSIDLKPMSRHERIRKSRDEELAKLSPENQELIKQEASKKLISFY